MARALDGVELFGRTLAVRAQYGSRAAVLEMAAEMSGELGSKSGEPFSSNAVNSAKKQLVRGWFSASRRMCSAKFRNVGAAAQNSMRSNTAASRMSRLS